MISLLLPCPFCGSEAILKTGIFSGQGGGKVAWVECIKCHCRTPEVDEWKRQPEEKAIELWNTRNYVPV